jgi:hypothetical protein
LLCDLTEFSVALIEIGPERIQQCCFAVVDVTHDRDDGGAHAETIFSIVRVNQLCFDLLLEANKLDGFISKNLKLIRTNVV